jgi:signal peptidase I
MVSDPNKPHPVDSRIILYRMAKQVAGIVAIVFLLKLLVIDIIPIQGSQMAPAVQNSDRVLVLRLPYLPIIRIINLPSRGNPVIFSIPFTKKFGCLRIAGVSGDTVSVEDGIFRNSKSFVRQVRASDTTSRNQVMPAEFSPRDYIDPYRVPAPGDTLHLDSLDYYGACFAAAVVRQENPSAPFNLIPRVLIDDTVSVDYDLSEFALFKGSLDSIPDSLRYDWFFWKRLSEFLQESIRDRKVSLSFEFFQNQGKITRYAVKKRFLFLLADNWNKGYDSRYFGPVIASSIFGRPFFILWSFSKKEGKGKRLNLGRLGRFIE